MPLRRHISSHGQIHQQLCLVRTVDGKTETGPQNRDPDPTPGPCAKKLVSEQESFTRADSRSGP